MPRYVFEELVDALVRPDDRSVPVTGRLQPRQREVALGQVGLQRMCEGDPDQIILSFGSTFEQIAPSLTLNDDFRTLSGAATELPYASDDPQVIVVQNDCQFTCAQPFSSTLSYHRLPANRSGHLNKAR